MNYEQILQAAKDEVAKSYGYKNWDDLFDTRDKKGVETSLKYAALLAMQRVADLSITNLVVILPSSDDIEANGLEGGLTGNELQMFWEGAEWLKGHIRKQLSTFFR